MWSLEALVDKMSSILNPWGLALLFALSGAQDPSNIKMLVAEELAGNPRKEEIMSVIECESGFQPTVQSWHKDPKGPNGRENSWGLVQINLDYNDVALEDALDWKYSLDFIQKHFKAGRESMWTCWRDLNDLTYDRD